MLRRALTQLANLQRPCSFKPFHNDLRLSQGVKYYYMRPKKPQRSESHPFSIQEKKVGKHQDEESKKYGYLHIAMYGFVFACCFAGIPIYRVFCEKVGLLGNYDKKTYQFEANRDRIANLKKFKVKFEGQPEPGIDWEFEPVQNEVIMGTSETGIVFYRLYNKEDYPIVGFSTYNITPEEVNIYFSKIQCFCFNQQMINPKEELLLPLFFYLEPELIEDPDVGRIREIKVHYDFIKSNKQDLAKFAQQELEKVENNKRKLREMRAAKKNMTLQDYEEMLYEEEIAEKVKMEQEMEDNSSKEAAADLSINIIQSGSQAKETKDDGKNIDVESLQPISIKRTVKEHNEEVSTPKEEQTAASTAPAAK